MGFDLQLEPKWQYLHVTQRVSVVAHLIIWDEHQQEHLFRSSLTKKLLVVEGEVGRHALSTFFDAEVTSLHNGIRLRVDGAKVLGHQPMTWDSLYKATDVCSGMGFGAQGFSSAGISVEAVNELRPALVNFQWTQGVTHIQCGDLGEVQTLIELHSMCPHSTNLFGGFSCQPWSRLGDLGQTGDHRSSSLLHILRAGHFLCSHTIVLECVQGAGKDINVMRTIQDFCAQTGFTFATTELSLGTLFPARRDRWWCVLTNPCFPRVNLRPLPSVPKMPTVGDLLPFCPWWEETEVKQLALDTYESRNFAAYGGLEKNYVNSNGQLPTALHGWGNQLDKCPCGCRAFPMSESRLEQKGLHGALILLDGCFSTSNGPLQKTRHVHPSEVAILHGVNPNQQWKPSLRLSLAGLGQMASPIQSNWVISQTLFQVEKKFDLPTKLPEVRLGDHIKIVMNGFQQVQPALAVHPTVTQFLDKVWTALEVSILASHPTVGSGWFVTNQNKRKQPPAETEELSTENNQPPETGGRKITKQPPSESAELGKSNNQPPVKTEELESRDKQPAGRSPEPDRSRTDAPYPVVPPIAEEIPTPFADANQSSAAATNHQPHHAHGGIPGFAVLPVKDTPSGEVGSATQALRTHFADGPSPPTHVDDPPQDAVSPSKEVEPQNMPPTCPSTIPWEAEERPSEVTPPGEVPGDTSGAAGPAGPSESEVPESPPHAEDNTTEHAIGSVGPEVPSAADSESARRVDPDPQQKQCRVIRSGDVHGIELTAQSSATVGSITIAEDRLFAMTQPIRITTHVLPDQ
eukprot:Skav204444  [mRNA]  locus=scaffold1093:336223:338625:+ [translate_table: standard]